MLSNRQIQILKTLSDNTEYMTTKELAKKFQVSSRSIRNDLDMIQYFMKDQPIEMIRKPHYGIKLINNQNINIDRLMKDHSLKVYSKEERGTMIIVLLSVYGKITIEVAAEKLEVSKNTIVQDLKEVEKILQYYGVCLIRQAYYGLTLEGNEEVIRNAIFNIYIRMLKENEVDILGFVERNSMYDRNEIKQIINKVEQKMELKFADDSLRELEGMLMISLCRCAKGFHIQCGKEKNVLELNDYLCVKSVLEETTEVKVTEGDLYYFLILLKSTKIVSYDFQGKTKEDQRVKLVTKSLIKDFCNYLEIEIPSEDDLITQIILHLKVAVFRLQNHIKIENPFLKDIQYSHAFMYEITEKIIKKNEKMLGVEFPDEEIAYTTMYFEVLFQESLGRNLFPKAALVCNGGTATSVLLRQKINEAFPSMQIERIYRANDVIKGNLESQVDLVISTVPIEVEGCRVILVNPLLRASDIERMKKIISVSIYNKKNEYLAAQIQQPMITDMCRLLDEKFCQFNLEIENWEEAIAAAAKPLVEARFIKEEYVDDMIQTVYTMGNYMVFVPEIAFVHGKRELVRKDCISFLKLGNIIEFGSKSKVDVKIIIVLGNTAESENLVNLVRILTSGDNIEKMKNVNSYKDFMEITLNENRK